ncbi:GTPase HflX [uncultured Fibrobacter sp.]|uniref:GTPase HflX n=1 Tax=uncultured Fibrobacter sp. TaxID=261512 RepID=UPI00259704BC|nr:GTPase HflX [uncultured Fibrobacter sp.]
MQQALENAILVGIVTPNIRKSTAKEHLSELERLAETAGAVVCRTFLQRVQAFNPATLIGEGKVQEIRAALDEENAKLLVFDEDLSGSQVRNLEERLPGIKVLDRTGIILAIFAKHAVTAESRLMVEVAQLQYLVPRLSHAWTHLSRQAGGKGIGMNGPGETQLETDRRIIRKKIQEIKKKLEKIESARERQAERRKGIFQVGIVGYTNAGKSTLTNRLTSSSVYVKDQLFATLDNTMRKLYVGDGKFILLSDTVGFIRKLPPHLLDTFKSTLSAASNANCILNVVDATANDYEEHLEITHRILQELVDEKVPRIIAFNKAEAASEERRKELLAHYPEALQISAKENIGMEALKQKLISAMQDWEKNQRIGL